MMNIKINTETRELTIESYQQIKLSDIFNFLHKIDADNVDQWVITTNTNDCICLNPNLSISVIEDDINYDYENSNSSELS